MLAAISIDSATIGIFVVLILSIAFHEAAHAFVADALGDDTARKLGRVTLNPLPHIDPVLSILLPILSYYSGLPAFGGGKPVPINASKFRHPWRDYALVGLAGPASNIVLALLCTALLVVTMKIGLTHPNSPSETWLKSGISLNLLLAIFNLIPIPPLDGSRFLGYLLPRGAERWYYRLDQFGFVIVMLLVFTGVMGHILQVTFVPVSNWWHDIYMGWIIG